MKAYFADKEGKRRPLWFGSYGIGSTRVMGTLVEVSHDEKGIIWYPQIAPFDAHLVELPGGNAKDVYQKLIQAGIDCLWDDREVGAGEKFSDADLLGIPVRLVVSKSTGENIEFKLRNSDNRLTLSLDETIKRLNDIKSSYHKS